MITESSRQGFYMLFIILLMFIGPYILKMSFFECFMIVCLSGIILKLTDIQDTLRTLRK